MPDEPLWGSRAGIDGSHGDFLTNRRPGSKKDEGVDSSNHAAVVDDEEWVPSGVCLLFALVFVAFLVWGLPAALSHALGTAFLRKREAGLVAARN